MATIIRHGDGLAVATGLPDRSINALVTDPPYCSGAVAEAKRTAAKGTGLRSETLRRFQWFKGDNMTTAGLAFLLRALAFEACRFLTDEGSALVFMDWRMVPTLVPAIESAGLRWQNLIVWNKRSMGTGTGFRAQHELVAHFTNGAPVYHHRGTGNVISVPRIPTDKRRHPTEKPHSVLTSLIRVVCPPGGVIFDPFGGSGTTAEAGATLGVDVIIAEREPYLIDGIRDAVAQQQHPLNFEDDSR